VIEEHDVDWRGRSWLFTHARRRTYPHPHTCTHTHTPHTYTHTETHTHTHTQRERETERDRQTETAQRARGLTYTNRCTPPIHTLTTKNLTLVCGAATLRGNLAAARLLGLESHPHPDNVECDGCVQAHWCAGLQPWEET
jgi:hypothetical protein